MLMRSTALLLIVGAQPAVEEDDVAGYYRAPRQSCIDMGAAQPALCRSVYDSIEIAPRAQDGFYVQIGTRGPDAHQCWFGGIGRWRDGAMVVTTKHPHSGAICRVSIHFASKAAWYEIEPETVLACFGYRTYFCSMKADLAPNVRHKKHPRRADR